MKTISVVLGVVLYSFILSYCSYISGRDAVIERATSLFGGNANMTLGLKFYLQTGDEKFLEAY
jgi:hypothetical protein